MAIPERHRDTVRTAAIAAGAVGVPGALSFGLDISAMAGIWTGMTATIADESGHELDRTFATKLAASLATGVGAYLGGSKIAVSLLNAVPVAGTLTAMGVNSSLNFWFTYRVGRSVAGLFGRPDYGLMDAGDVALVLLPVITRLPQSSEVRDMLTLVRG